MNIHTKITDPVKVEADVLVVFAWSGKKKDEFVFSSEASKVNNALGGFLATMLTAEGFTGAAGKNWMIHTQGKIPATRVLVVGVGDVSTLTISQFHKALAAAARRVKDSKSTRMAISLSPEIANVLGWEEGASAVSEAILLGTYAFLRHKTVGLEALTSIEECIVLTTANKVTTVTSAVSRGQVMSEAVIVVRDLVNESPSTTTPTHLGNVAKSLVKGQKNMTCEVFGKPELEKMGMGGLLGIARGSDEEPKFIKLSYKGGGGKTVALIGKGITFDSGGLSIKPAQSMETMKLDMAGAATILGVFSALATLQPSINVVGLISATENMLGPKAVKPGDIVKAMNGKTIEILNTDAEGRVVLSDALSYAVSKVKPDVMIDLATLTGACVVALGEDVAGLFASHDALAADLLKAAKKTGEGLWQLPLVDEYRDMIKSSIADVKNIGGGRWGGAITAALFLQEFTDPAIPWAHLDIAGPAFAEKETPMTPTGATGYGVRMLLSYLQLLK
jgi:leucyl aminopeptidase